MSSLAKSVRGEEFQYFAPISFFEKSDAPEGERRRFGGIATTEEVDQEGEVILQNGLDWSYFLTKGWFNDNHSKKTGGVVGYPTSVQFFREGERLPDGTVAKANLHWTEGYLLEGVRAADEIWDVGRALAKSGSGRRLGQSIEGRIKKRTGPNGLTVAKAEVHHSAITHCPVNAGTSLGFLAKALLSVAESISGEIEEKALTAGAEVSPSGPTTGEGAGRILTPESLEEEEKECAEKTRKALGFAEQFAFVRARFPNLSAAACGRVLDTIHALRRAETEK